MRLAYTHDDQTAFTEFRVLRFAHVFSTVKIGLTGESKSCNLTQSSLGSKFTKDYRSDA
jgi:hypothetical protein